MEEDAQPIKSMGLVMVHKSHTRIRYHALQ